MDPDPIRPWILRSALLLSGQRFPSEELLIAGVDLSMDTTVGSECEEQQINSGIALPFWGRSSTHLSSDQIMVLLLSQPQLTGLLLLW